MIQTLLHVKKAIRTTLTGMRITGKYFRPGTEVTHLYPEEPAVVFERTRGRMEVSMDTCIACTLCARTCPIGCITIETEKKLEGKGKRCAVYTIDFSRCMYCGLCVESCPTQAIRHTGVCDFSSYELKDLIVEFGVGFYTEEEKRAAEEKTKAEQRMDAEGSAGEPEA